MKRYITNLTKQHIFVVFDEAYLSFTNFIFTALHGMQTRSSDENSVCLSVRLSHAWIVTKR